MPGKFKVNFGHHSERDLFFGQGSRFYSVSDLDVKFNSVGSVKFERLSDDAEVEQGIPMNAAQTVIKTEAPEQKPAPTSSSVPDNSGDTFNDMTVDQLKTFAHENEIDLGGATKKADIIAVLVAAQ